MTLKRISTLWPREGAYAARHHHHHDPNANGGNARERQQFADAALVPTGRAQITERQRVPPAAHQRETATSRRHQRQENDVARKASTPSAPPTNQTTAAIATMAPVAGNKNRRSME